MGENANSAVEGTRKELSAVGGEVNVSDCSNMSLVDGPGLFHASQIERVAVGVIIADN